MGKCRLCNAMCRDDYLASQNQLCIACWNKYLAATDPAQARFRRD